MDRFEAIDEIEDLGMASVETQGHNGHAIDVDLSPTLGSGISND